MQKYVCMETLQKLPIGIQDFESLRNNGYLYVDKTRMVYDLISRGKYYVLSRPRRFGKSLLMSTLHAYFDGNKKLFEGLAIAELEKEWVKRPVLHLDLNTNKYDCEDILEQKLSDSLSIWEKEYGCPTSTLPLGMRFEKVIQSAYEKTGKEIAILVDEYDKPMHQAIGNIELQDAFRATLDGTAEEALEQIKDKSYTLPFELDWQKVIRIGMNFSKETRNIEKYIVE